MSNLYNKYHNKMGIQNKNLNTIKETDSSINLGDTKIDIPKYDERIADTLVENDATIVQMYQDLIEPPKCIASGWDRLTFDKYKKLKRIKNIFEMRIRPLEHEYCKTISEIDESIIAKLFDRKQKLGKIVKETRTNTDMIVFFSKLAETGILDDFIEIFDDYPKSECNVINMDLFEGVDFQNIKKMKSYIKSKHENIVFDLDVFYRLKSLESIEYVGDILLKGVEKGGENYVILNANKLGTDYMRAEKQGENEYIINAYMPSHPVIAGRSYILLLQYLPQGAKIVEKESLSVNSFNNIINLYSKPESRKKWDIKKIIFQNKIRLNNEGEIGKLARLVKEKNIGKDMSLFEARSKDDAEIVVEEINKTIYRYTGDKSIYAEVKEIKKEGGESTWGVDLPSFIVEKY